MTSRAAAAVGAALVAMGAAASAQAQPAEDPRGGAGFALYSDDLDTVIWTPYVRAGATVGSDVELDAHWTADIISSASVDVISAATPRMSEARHEIGLTARREHMFAGLDLDLTGSYSYSIENDSDAHVGQIGVGRGFFEDNIELALRYALSLNRLGVRGEPSSAWLPSRIHTVDVTLTVLVNPRTLTELVYSSFRASGFLASPYRRVPIARGENMRSAQWVAERVPDTRLRHALTARLRRAVGARWVVALDYRLYTDDWGVRGHTEKLEVAVDLPQRLALRLQQRASLQGAADFYRERYTQQDAYMTRDRRLSDNLSGQLGAALTWTAGRIPGLGSIDLRVAADGLLWRYDEFDAPALSGRSTARLAPLGWVRGAVVQLGVEVRP